MNLCRLAALSAVAVACSIANAAVAEPAARAPLATTGGASRVIAGAAPVASAKAGLIRVRAVTIPPSVSERTRVMLRDAVEQRLSESVAQGPRGSYSVSVALLQLRRYIGPDGDEPKMVCIGDLALHDASGVLIGSVRGRASAVSATPKEVLDAAARSAVSRVPEALQRVVQSAVQTPDAYARR